MESKTRFVGTCPVCEKEFKLADGWLVHHGYRRPGDGFIHGDCFAVGYRPYEVSDEGCRAYKYSAESDKKLQEEFLVRLQAGEMKEFTVNESNRWEPARFVTVTQENDPARFARILADRIRETKTQISMITFEIERMGWLISNWSKKPVRSFDEVLQDVAKGKAERKAERDAKREARIAKERAKAEKRAAFEQAKADLIAKYKEIFEAMPTTLAAKEAWIAMHKEMNKRAYLYFYARELQCDDALKALGLAKECTNRIQYAYPDGTVWVLE